MKPKKQPAKTAPAKSSPAKPGAKGAKAAKANEPAGAGGRGGAGGGRGGGRGRGGNGGVGRGGDRQVVGKGAKVTVRTTDAGKAGSDKQGKQQQGGKKQTKITTGKDGGVQITTSQGKPNTPKQKASQERQRRAQELARKADGRAQELRQPAAKRKKPWKRPMRRGRPRLADLQLREAADGSVKLTIKVVNPPEDKVPYKPGWIYLAAKDASVRTGPELDSPTVLLGKEEFVLEQDELIQALELARIAVRGQPVHRIRFDCSSLMAVRKGSKRLKKPVYGWVSMVSSSTPDTILHHIRGAREIAACRKILKDRGGFVDLRAEAKQGKQGGKKARPKEDEASEAEAVADRHQRKKALAGLKAGKNESKGPCPHRLPAQRSWLGWLELCRCSRGFS